MIYLIFQNTLFPSFSWVGHRHLIQSRQKECLGSDHYASRRYAIKNLKKLKSIWNFNCSFFMKVCIFLYWITLLQSGLGLQMNYRPLIRQYLPNQATNNESMKKCIKKILKSKSWFDSEPLCTNQLIPRRTFGLWYSHTAQLITQAVFLCGNYSSSNYVTQSLCILQRMTKS